MNERRKKERPALFSQRQTQLREHLQAVQQQLVDSQNQVARLERELTSLHAEQESVQHMVAHDLRAPLRHIGAFVGLAREDLGTALTPEVASHLETIEDSARQMARLIDAMLALSRVGRVVLQRGNVPLQALVGELCAHFEAANPQRRFQWHIAPDLPELEGDLALVRDLFSALIGNAVKFTARRELAVIDIGWHAPEPGWVLLQVTDNGAGFNASHTAKLFQLFARLHSSNDFSGMGAGLATVKKIAERHGAVVAAHGEVDQGCTVTLRWPVASARSDLIQNK